MTPANPDALADALAALEQARATQRDLHRRAQKAENFRERHRGGINWLINSKRKERFARRAAEAERDAFRDEAYALKLAAAGGEDAPGSAVLVTADDVRRWRDEEVRSLRAAEACAAQLQAEVEALRAERASLRADANALGARLGNASQYDDRRVLRDLCWEAGNFLARRIVRPVLPALAARAATAREGQADA